MAREETQETTQETTNAELQLIISPAQWRDVKSFDEAMALVQSVYGNIAKASDVIGDGFELLESDEKKRLVKVPLMFASWTFSDGDHGEFASVRVVTMKNDKFIINDGSTGIYRQLKDYTEQFGATGGLFIQRGLRVSEYTYEAVMPDGAVTRDKAHTYYIDASL